MRARHLPLLLVLCTGPATSEPLAGGADCGGDAFSSAQVIEHRPPRRGPVTAMSETLCADLGPQGPPTRIDVYANPVILPENGGGGQHAPYGGRPRNAGPPRPSRP